MMKKYKIAAALTITSLLIGITSCKGLYSDNEPKADKIETNITNETGNAKISLIIPDYYKLAGTNEARVIAPLTAQVKFSYYNSYTKNWVDHSTVSLSDAEKTSIEGLNIDFPGSMYTLNFTAVPSGLYSPENMKLELLDAEGNVLTTGTNTSAIVISLGETSSGTFYTLPEELSSSSGSLAEHEMKFLKKKLTIGKTYSLKISVGDGDSYPDVVVFNKNGSFENYYSMATVEDNTISIGEQTETTEKIIAVWAPTEAISKYKYEFTVTGTIPGAVNFTEFNETGLGTEETFHTLFDISGSSSLSFETDGGKDGDAAVKFNFMNNTQSSISRTLIFNDATVFSFYVKTDLYEDYDGTLDFYVDNERVDSFTGLNSDWRKASFTIEEGEHTLTWKKNDPSSSWTSGITNTAYISSFSLSELKLLTSLNETFSGEEIPSYMDTNGTVAISTDQKLASWVQYEDALVDRHEGVLSLAEIQRGISSVQIKNISAEEESALTVQYKTDLWTSAFFRIYVDDTQLFEDTGYGNIWQEASVIIPEGIHTVKIAVENSDGYKGAGTITNLAYIDNITLAANKVESVDIYPKGLQETYAYGTPIQFTAKALRSDGSVIEGKTVSWASTRGSIDENGLFTPGSENSSYITVSARIDGISGYNSTVKIHSSDYLSDPVTLAGKTFTGEITNKYGTCSNTQTITWQYPQPGTSFSADGFFVVKGNVTRSGQWGPIAMLKIKKGNYETYVYLKGNFYERVWLRFGPGEYTITAYDTTLQLNNTGDENYIGDLALSYSLSSGNTFYVTNTNDSVSAEDAPFLLPSSWCQNDDFLITNAVTAIMAELPEDATVGEKLTALHDWETHRMHYDNVSFNHDSKRKTQNAKQVLGYGMGVCEGYANLFTALERDIGVKGRVICSSQLNHAWNNTYYNGEWLLVDTCWDDPISNYDDSNVEKNPFAENYKYFLLTSSEDSQTGNSHGTYAISATVATQIGGDGWNAGRSTTPSDNTQPYSMGMPDGWY